jgi:uncharacterized protein (DUF58 family)
VIPTNGSTWRATRAHLRSSTIAVAGVVAALALHRPDLLVAVTPLVIISCWSVVSRPVAVPVLTSTIGSRSLREGQATTMRYAVTCPPGLQDLTVILSPARFVETRPVKGVVTVGVVPGQESAEVDVTLRVMRWGERPAGPALAAATSSWAAYQWGPVTDEARTISTMPAAAVFDAAAPMPHPLGHVGIDRAARPGDGSEFASIRPFQLGDRLRRIHWPASLRSQKLNVTSTYADQDSQVLVLVDAANDLGTSEGIGGTASTLDVTVRAAAALCEHYLRRGDRVSLRVVGSVTPTVVPASTGQAHLRRMLATLSRSRPGGGFAERDGSTRYRVEPGAIVIVCSPLVSPVIMQRTLGLAGRGLTLIVIDTMPEGLAHTVEDENVDLAWRIRMLERSVDVRQVAEAGVPVVPWRGPGSLDQVLRDISRRARAPRLAHR